MCCSVENGATSMCSTEKFCEDPVYSNEEVILVLFL
jgi:hypothetical protein